LNINDIFLRQIGECHPVLLMYNALVVRISTLYSLCVLLKRSAGNGWRGSLACTLIARYMRMAELIRGRNNGLIRWPGRKSLYRYAGTQRSRIA
jgi:hypothetical protein